MEINLYINSKSLDELLDLYAMICKKTGYIPFLSNTEKTTFPNLEREILLAIKDKISMLHREIAELNKKIGQGDKKFIVPRKGDGARKKTSTFFSS